MPRERAQANIAFRRIARPSETVSIIRINEERGAMVKLAVPGGAASR
jgi:hypothetical protein